MAAKEHKHTHREPYECPACGAMVFVLDNLHAVLCKEIKKHPELIKGSHDWYKKYKAAEAEEAIRVKEARDKKPRKSRKNIEKNTELQTEELALGED